MKNGVPDGNEPPTETVLGIPLTEIVALVTLAGTNVDPGATGFEETLVVLDFLPEPGFEEADVEGEAQVAVSAVTAGSALAALAQSVICW